MLAQSFMTAKDLDLTDEQHSALIKVLALLETEEITYLPSRKDLLLLPKKHYFNMAIWYGPNPKNLNEVECGTMGCIGGTAGAIAGDSLLFDINHLEPGGCKDDTALSFLFFPNIHTGYASITAEQAATALRSYLTTGSCDWTAITGQPFWDRRTPHHD